MKIDKDFLGVITILLSLVSAIPYCRAIILGRIRPHIFTRLIWGLTAAIVLAAQIAEHAGPGAWSTGMAAIVCFLAVVLSLRNGDRHITRFDWICLVLALAAIPLWYVTDDPLGAVILVTAIDGVGYLPSFRNIWRRPHDDMVYAFALSTLRHSIAIGAMEHYSLTNLIYPVFCAVSDLGFVGLMLTRRFILRGQ